MGVQGSGETRSSNTSEGTKEQRQEATTFTRPTTFRDKATAEKLNIIYLNARSIVSKLSELEVLINDNNPDIVLITESWCNSSISDALLNIQGYNLETELRTDRNDTQGGIGGGLLVYSRIGITIIPKQNASNFNQYCSFIVKCENTDDLHISLIYRSPNSSNENNTELLKFIENHEKNMFLVGDFNLPGINWSDGITNSKCRPFYECIQNKQLSQVVEFCTHKQGGLLDWGLLDRDDILYEVENLGYLGSSDHVAIRFELDVGHKFNHSEEKVRDWGSGNNAALFSYLRNVNWNDKMSNLDTELAWSEFNNVVNIGLDRYIPLKPRRSNFKPPWMTKKIKRLCNKKKRLWKIFRTTRNPSDEDAFKTCQKECTKVVRAAKRRHEKKLSNKENTRGYNAYVKRRLKTKPNIGPLKDDRSVVNDDVGMAELLNRYFCSVFNAPDNNDPPVIPNSNSSSLSNIHFTVNDVKQKLSNLKPSGAPGPDGISNRFLKEFSDVLATPLQIIFNKSMSESAVPKDWREANVTPIFKKGSKSNPGNYRPVSLTSVVCKVMESLINDRITEYLTQNNLINKTQHGFMKSKSCSTNLLEFLELVLGKVDAGIPMDVVYLDFSKAFDKVPWRRLMSKVKAKGINGRIFKWIENWLKDRKQRVVINGGKSDWRPVTSGVPQGSVLGPLLFLIYIDDIDLEASSNVIVRKFADDTKLGHSVQREEEQEQLQESLLRMYSWAEKWGMSFNLLKCKVMHLGYNNPKYIYKVNGIEIPSSDSEKDLGVLIANNLRPSSHCLDITRKANAVLGQLCRAFHYRDRHIFKRLYVQQVRPLLEFASTVWSPWTAADINTLESVQKRFVGMVSGLRGTTYNEKLSELDLLSLEERRLVADLVQVFKSIHHIDKIDYRDWFELVGQNPNINTRATSHPLNIRPQRVRLDVYKNFYSQRVVPYWNSLPSDLKDKNTINSFRTCIREWIVTRRQTDDV